MKHLRDEIDGLRHQLATRDKLLAQQHQRLIKLAADAVELANETQDWRNIRILRGEK